jgi:2,5-dioxopentanoate dehydrogenase
MKEGATMPGRMPVTGSNLVAGEESAEGRETFHAVDPVSAQRGSTGFREATTAEIQRAVAAAADASAVYGEWPGPRRAALLRTAADDLDGAREQIVATAAAETGLDEARLTGELGRTTTQLRAFADLAEDGSYVGAIIDTANTHPVLGALPDIRRMLVPLGPVAVFGASNFPLAFSVAGGDTASALAVGCPVVAKAHPSHPGTSELAGRALAAAVRAAGAPPGTFSMLHGRSPDVSRALVTATQIKAVGFTGSHRVGRLLYDLAARRPDPIPVYAEMGSLNPLFVTPGAIGARAAEIAAGYAGSMTLGNGQFCTKPGLLFVPDDDAGRSFLERVAALVGQMSAGPLLNEGIAAALGGKLETSRALPGVQILAEGHPGEAPAGFGAAPVLLATDYATFRATPQLRAEHFGPVAIGVRVPHGKYAEAAAALDGSLTGTIHAEPHEAETVAPLAAALREKVGRLIWNGYPTGVAVVPSMQHGGPYPATTFPGHTSVGLTAVRRFLRPVAYQNAPEWLLPPALRDANPLRIRRLVNGTWTDAADGPGS